MAPSIGRPGPLPCRRGEGPEGSLSHDLTDARSQGGWPRHIRPYPGLLPEGAKAEGIRVKRVKLREAKADARKRGVVARSCARAGRKDAVGEVKGIEMMGVHVAVRGTRERGGRRLEVEVNSKR